jgi:hypothetical protein
MRLLTIILTLLLTACTMGVSQQPSKEAKKEIEFYEILKKANAAQEVNRTFIKTADNNSEKIITKTVTNIVSLKNEVKQLKTELNETNKKLDSVNSNTGIKFRFSAISADEKDR